jgi:surfactin synthase thioesterase subunit
MNPAAAPRLFCFPHAGGGAMAYNPWRAAFGSELEVCAVELPGRGTRRREPLERDGRSLAAALRREWAGWLDEPFALFGHSMGALLAFEVAQQLTAAGGPVPLALFLSGAAAPHLPRTPITALPDAAFLAQVRDFGGMPDDLFEEPSLMAHYTPILRADFAVLEGYRLRRAPLPDCPVHLFGGDRDHRITPSLVAAWRDVLPVATTTFLPGGHFYLIDQLAALAAAIREVLVPAGRAAAGPARRPA